MVALIVKIFDTPQELADFAALAGNSVATIYGIVTDSSGKYLLFYTTT